MRTKLPTEPARQRLSRSRLACCSSEAPIISSRSVHRWHLRPKQAQVDRHLSTVMRRVQEGIANHLVTRLLERQLTGREQAPGRLEMRIGSRLQGLARLGNGLVERRHELRACVQWEI